MTNLAQNYLKVAHIFNLEMFTIFRLQYLRQYTMHFKISYRLGFLTSIQIHTYITHSYQRLITLENTLPNSGTATECQVFFSEMKFTCITWRFTMTLPCKTMSRAAYRHHMAIIYVSFAYSNAAVAEQHFFRINIILTSMQLITFTSKFLPM